ncbi:MAG: hypothetical protein H0T62_07570 [Parachlamydiaceae bacterium]|nr:hypothetical protein [Parachlamydiaceae bacterium]
MKVRDIINLWLGEGTKRRLEKFRRAQSTQVTYRMANPEEIAAEAWKLTSSNGGTSARIRRK